MATARLRPRAAELVLLVVLRAAALLVSVGVRPADPGDDGSLGPLLPSIVPLVAVMVLGPVVVVRGARGRRSRLLLLGAAAVVLVIELVAHARLDVGLLAPDLLR